MLKSHGLLGSLLLLGCCAMDAHAQFFHDFGVRGGLTISRLEVSASRPAFGPDGIGYAYVFTDQPVINPAFGICATLFRSDIVDVQADLSYLRLGARRTETLFVTTAESPDGNGETASLTTEIGVQYLSLDLLAKPHLDVGGMELSIQVGPTLGYLVQSFDLAEYGGNLSRWQLGYRFGAGVDPGALIGTKIFLEVSYAADVKYFYDASIAKYSNRTWLVTIGTRL
jgi:hypothetical protein